MEIKNKIVATIVEFLPLIFITLGLIAFTVAGFLFNPILGTIFIGITLIILGLMLVPIKINNERR